MDGNTALGASSPAKPALHMPEPLSTTKAATSSSHILELYFYTRRELNVNPVDIGLIKISKCVCLFMPSYNEESCCECELKCSLQVLCMTS